jgi:hypothetical protein
VIEKNTPNNGNHVTMKKKAVHKFLIPLAHAIFVHHDDVPLPKIIQGEDLT